LPDGVSGVFNHVKTGTIVTPGEGGRRNSLGIIYVIPAFFRKKQSLRYPEYGILAPEKCNAGKTVKNPDFSLRPRSFLPSAEI
jgi:hypothetical protein